MEIQGIVDDMLCRYQRHEITYDWDGQRRISKCRASCSCGWSSETASEDLRPQVAAVDQHMIDAVVPPWPRELCWCGRVILRTPMSTWTHAADEFLGHDARPSAGTN